jgi:hypothetical protein
MFYPYLYGTLVYERLADAHREAEHERLLRQVQRPRSLRRRVANLAGKLLIAVGKRLAGGAPLPGTERRQGAVL